MTTFYLYYCNYALFLISNHPGVDISQGIPTNKVTALNKQRQALHILCIRWVNVDFYVAIKII